jgi:hypothetical protein
VGIPERIAIIVGPGGQVGAILPDSTQVGPAGVHAQRLPGQPAESGEASIWGIAQYL